MARLPFRKEELDEFNHSAVGNDPATETKSLPESKIRRRIATNELRKNLKARIQAAKKNRAATIPDGFNISVPRVQLNVSDEAVPRLSKIGLGDLPDTKLSNFDRLLGFDFKTKKKDGFSEMLGL